VEDFHCFDGEDTVVTEVKDLHLGEDQIDVVDVQEANILEGERVNLCEFQVLNLGEPLHVLLWERPAQGKTIKAGFYLLQEGQVRLRVAEIPSLSQENAKTLLGAEGLGEDHIDRVVVQVELFQVREVMCSFNRSDLVPLQVELLKLEHRLGAVGGNQVLDAVGHHGELRQLTEALDTMDGLELVAVKYEDL